MVDYNREWGFCLGGLDYARSPTHRWVMGEAFDAAWAEIYVRVAATNPVAIEDARLTLADAVLSVASEDSRDVEALKKAALQKIGLGLT